MASTLGFMDHDGQHHSPCRILWQSQFRYGQSRWLSAISLGACLLCLLLFGWGGLTAETLMPEDRLTETPVHVTRGILIVGAVIIGCLAGVLFVHLVLGQTWIEMSEQGIKVPKMNLWKRCWQFVETPCDSVKVLEIDAQPGIGLSRIRLAIPGDRPVVLKSEYFESRQEFLRFQTFLLREISP